MAAAASFSSLPSQIDKFRKLPPICRDTISEYAPKEWRLLQTSCRDLNQEYQGKVPSHFQEICRRMDELPQIVQYHVRSIIDSEIKEKMRLGKGVENQKEIERLATQFFRVFFRFANAHGVKMPYYPSMGELMRWESESEGVRNREIDALWRVASYAIRDAQDKGRKFRWPRKGRFGDIDWGLVNKRKIHRPPEIEDAELPPREIATDRKLEWLEKSSAVSKIKNWWFYQHLPSCSPGLLASFKQARRLELIGSFTIFPVCISEMTGLQHLVLRALNLEVIPQGSFTKLRHLKFIRIESQNLTAIPYEICEIRLKKLNLSKCPQLTLFPKGVREKLSEIASRPSFCSFLRIRDLAEVGLKREDMRGDTVFGQMPCEEKYHFLGEMIEYKPVLIFARSHLDASGKPCELTVMKTMWGDIEISSSNTYDDNYNRCL